jgi:hypothetical protein
MSNPTVARMPNRPPKLDAAALLSGTEGIEVEREISAAELEKCRKTGQGSNWLHNATRFAIYARDGYQCAYCDFVDPYRIGGTWFVEREGGKYKIEGRQYTRLGITVDHVVSCEKGGSNRASNLVTCCYGCNSSKKEKSKWQWFLYLNEVHGYSTSNILDLRRDVKNRLRRELDRKEGKRAGEEAHRLRAEARESASGKWGFGRHLPGM